MIPKHHRILGVLKQQMQRVLGRSKLSQRQQALLNLMRQDNLRAGMPFRASPMWRDLAGKMDAVLRREGIDVPEAQAYNTMFSQSRPGSPRYHQYAHWMLYLAVRQKDRLGILERVQATVNPKTALAYVFEGKTVSWDLLVSVDTLYAIEEVYPGILTEPVVVADLGAGWGRIGYVLKKVNPDSTYVVFDLPEPLLISISRLPQLLPDQSVVAYEEIRTMTRISKEALAQGEMWFCGSQDLARFDDDSIHVLINVASFQEMTKQQVLEYFRLIDRKVHGVFYTQQYWTHDILKSRYGVIGGFDEYPFMPHWHRAYVRNTTFSERYFEAAFTII